MRFRVLFLLAALLPVCPIGAFAGNTPENPGQPIAQESGTAVPWSSPEVIKDVGRFRFAIMADRTGGHRAGVFENAIRKIDLLCPDFVMCVGDLIEGQTSDAALIKSQWDEVQGIVGQLSTPFVFVPGNHDYGNATMAGIWKERFGPTPRSFVYQEVLFLCLNSFSTYGHGLPPEQVAWVAEELKQHADARWIMIFLHSPLWAFKEQAQQEQWAAMEKVLGDRNYTVFSGHYHKYSRTERGGHEYYTLATTGGASRLGGVDKGEFDHVMWVTMKPDGPVVANLMPDGILDRDPAKMTAPEAGK